jgi:hypothetical protein
MQSVKVSEAIGKAVPPAISSIIHGFFWATIKKSITEIPLPLQA